MCVCMYVFLGRRKYGYERLSIRPSVRTYFSPRLLNGPARGGKLIIYNRGTGGGDQRFKESEWKMRMRGVDGVKNRSGQWEGPGGRGSSTSALCTGYPLDFGAKVTAPATNGPE
jgi:hypothetical protein